jgi:hypothetical protein
MTLTREGGDDDLGWQFQFQLGLRAQNDQNKSFVCAQENCLLPLFRFSFRPL